MKLSGENPEVALHDLGLGGGLLHVTPNARATKEKNKETGGGEKEREERSKLDFTKLKTLMHQRKLLKK